jgi:arylformamidase
MSALSELEFEVGGRRFVADVATAHDLAVRLEFDGPQPNAFFLERARAEAVEADGFVGDTRLGGSANCQDVRLNPHGNGTHTECVGHIVDEEVAVGELARHPLMPATVISVAPERLVDSGESYDGAHAADDAVLTRAALEAAAGALAAPAGFLEALVIRTLPNEAAKTTRTYSGANPAYPTREAVDWLLDRGVEHLVLDLPSLDREDDGGTLPNHHLFFGVPAGRTTLDDAQPSTRTVTEMAYVPDEARDGFYLLSLQLPRFALDAAPSRPLLFGVQEKD